MPEDSSNLYKSSLANMFVWLVSNILLLPKVLKAAFAKEVTCSFRESSNPKMTPNFDVFLTKFQLIALKKKKK